MNAVILFSKYPEKGTVKTRLAKETSDDVALCVHNYCLRKLVSKHRDQSDYDFYIHTNTHAKKLGQMFSVSTDYAEGNTIGDWLNHAMHKYSEYKHIIFIGVDVPNIDSKIISQVLDLLKTKDIVVGPTYDGGFYLFGCSVKKDYFEGVRWSSEHTLADVLENVRKHGSTYKLLEFRRDIDTLNDIKEYPKLYEKLKELSYLAA